MHVQEMAEKYDSFEMSKGNRKYIKVNIFINKFWCIHFLFYLFHLHTKIFFFTDFEKSTVIHSVMSDWGVKLNFLYGLRYENIIHLKWNFLLYIIHIYIFIYTHTHTYKLIYKIHGLKIFKSNLSIWLKFGYAVVV